VLLPDNKTLVSGCKDGTVGVWDTSATHPRRGSITWPDRISNWRFAPDSRSVVTLDRQGQVTRWSGVDFHEKEPLLEITNYSGSLFSPDGRFLAVGSADGNISVWDVSRRVLRREFRVGEGSVTPLNFLARGNRLVCWTIADNRFSEWDLEATREIQSWPAPAYFSDSFGLSPDEQLGIGIGNSGQVQGRNLPGQSTTNVPLDVLEGLTVAFSADGKRLAVASALGFARVWDTATWREEATLAGFLNGVGSVAFSPDGQRLATGGTSPEDALKLWSMDSWQEVLTLEGPGSLYYSTAFSPDGTAIGTMTGDGFLRVWQAPSWAEINAAEAKEKAETKQP